VTRTADGVIGSVNVSNYSIVADYGSDFRIDPAACQYIDNLAVSWRRNWARTASASCVFGNPHSSLMWMCTLRKDRALIP
jgi:hypothetical protein